MTESAYRTNGFSLALDPFMTYHPPRAPLWLLWFVHRSWWLREVTAALNTSTDYSFTFHIVHPYTSSSVKQLGRTSNCLSLPASYSVGLQGRLVFGDFIDRHRP